MPAILEREIKLRFADPAVARHAVLKAGASPLTPRRLQRDHLLDSSEGALRDRRSTLRVRLENGQAFLTFKGPAQPSAMKLREELETTVGDGSLLLRVLEELGFRTWFRYEKYREEFSLNDVIVAIDETPVGTFVELEGSEAGIDDTTSALDRGPGDHLLESYRTLFVQHCERHGLVATNMLFADV